MIARLWLRLMARLFGPTPHPVARSTGTGPFLMGGSVRAAPDRYRIAAQYAQLAQYQAAVDAIAGAETWEDEE